MTLKELFDKAPNGTLTYDQLMAAAGDSKFVDLTEGNYVSKQKYTDELGQRDTRITTLEGTLTTRTTDLQNLQKTLADAGDIEALKTASNDLAELQKRYNTETKQYQKQIAEQRYGFAVKDFANGLQFTSAAAKREFVRAMTEKKLSIEGDTIIGATDFVTAYKAQNADSFVTEKPQEQNPTPQPQFVAPTPGNNNPQTTENAFVSAFSFTGVRPMSQQK